MFLWLLYLWARSLTIVLAVLPKKILVFLCIKFRANLFKRAKGFIKVDH